jgi:Raf kinase inhibitor-like YbhB/YbcL family protein
MRLISSAFEPYDWIPERYTCDGDNISPPLSWSHPPAGTRSFALICTDPDAPHGTWYHWAIYDLPEQARELPEDLSPAQVIPPQALNDFGHTGYGGPCPPTGPRPHHYCFTLYALEMERLSLPAHPRCRDVAAACSNALAEAKLIGLYGRN